MNGRAPISYTTTRVRHHHNTANNKILELSNDYDPKLYRQLNPTVPELGPRYSDELAFDSNFECGNLRQVYR